MKIKIWMLAAMLMIASMAHAATNDLTGLLQQGLFEEEANRNLDAAIANYQSLASAFDKDRQLAATAIFRLGECYRKLGKTNDAVIQYQRIIKEFSDQQTLVTLSQQNLAGLRPPSTSSNNSASLDNLRLELINAQRLVRSVDDTIESAHYTNRGPVLVHLFQNDKSMQFLADDQQSFLDHYRQLLKNHLDSEAKSIKEQIDAKQKEMEVRADELAAKAHDTANALEKEYQQRLADGESASSPSTTSANVPQNSPSSEQVRQLGWVKKMQAMPLPEVLQTAPTVLTDASLINLVYQYNQTELDLVRLLTDHAEDHLEVKKEKAIQAALKDKIYERLAGMSKALSVELGTATNPQAIAVFGGSLPGTSDSATTDEEQTEIRNIQAMIQNSPDLINAPNTANGGETPLQIAATKGQLVVAKYLLDHGADVDKRAQNGGADPGGSPLLLAAQYGHKTMVELLLAHGADVNGAHGPSPLNAAVSRGFTGVVDVLLANKADANAWGSNNGKVLHTAASKGDTNFIQLLIAHGADVNATDSNSNTPLHLAVHENKPDAVRILLSSKANLEARNKDGNTPLHEAASAGSSEIVSLLLRSGAKVDATNSHDATPLLLAAYLGQVDAVRLLLAAKADPNHIGQVPNAGGNYTSPVPPVYLSIWIMANNDVLKLLLDSGANPEGIPLPQYGPLRYAIDKHNLDAVRLLLEHGANPNRIDNATSPLKQALIDDKNKPMVPLLLDKGADPNAIDSEGFPPLFRTSDPDLVRLLIDHKADVNARGRNGDTALMRAMGRNAVNLIKILAEAGAKTDLQDTNGNTALHFAVENVTPEIVAALLKQKANPNLQNNGGYTPLDLAKGGSNRRMMLGADSQNQFVYIGSGSGSFNVSPPTEAEQKIIDLLINAGGLANLPKRDRIESRRGSSLNTTLYKDSHGYNRYSLLELIANAYELLSQNSSGEWKSRFDLRRKLLAAAPKFPNFKQVTVYRRGANSGKQISLKVNVDEILASGDCSKDIWLEWGDVVEIPETDHPVDEQWAGLSEPATAALIKCTSREITLKIKDESTLLKLAPQFDPSGSFTGTEPWFKLTPASFMLRSVLDNSKLIRVSSDLSRVKITRQDPLTKKTLVWAVDATDANQANFWLRDGDVIEVPEK